MVQDTGVTNRILDNQTAQGMSTLDGRIEVLEKQGSFLLDQQEQESNAWHNVVFNLHEEIQEGEQKVAILQDLLDVQRRSNQQLCLVSALFYGLFQTFILPIRTLLMFDFLIHDLTIYETHDTRTTRQASIANKNTRPGNCYVYTNPPP